MIGIVALIIIMIKLQSLSNNAGMDYLRHGTTNRNEPRPVLRPGQLHQAQRLERAA